jgi:hypothetical protein
MRGRLCCNVKDGAGIHYYVKQKRFVSGISAWICHNSRERSERNKSTDQGTKVKVKRHEVESKGRKGKDVH